MVSPKRLFPVMALLVTVAVVIVLRLIFLQVVESDRLEQEHERVFGAELELQPIRGQVLDRNGAVLGTTGYEYRITADPSQIWEQDLSGTAAILATLLVTRTSYIIPSLDPPRLADGSEAKYSVVASRVSPEVAEAIRQQAIWGIYVEPVQRRYYPHNHLLSHVLGWVDADMRGNSGVEGHYNEHLRGNSVTVSKYPMLHYEWSTPRPHDGATVVLTIDRTIQATTERVLADALVRYNAPSGTIIVMDLDGYGILAMASLPDFDPNAYYRTERQLLVNPAIARLFEPGSIHKVLTMAAAIDSGTVTPATVYNDVGVIEVGGWPIRNWDGAAHGITDMTTLLSKSLNVGAATIASWMGWKTYYQYMMAFGLADYTGIDLEGEGIGQLKQPGDDLWTESDLGTNSFGQGVAVTPLRELVSIAAIASGGTMYQPHVVAEVRDGDRVYQYQKTIIGQPISKESANTVREMMVQAVSREVSSASVPGYTIGGKTGTAQIPDGPIYHPSDIIGTFVGFLPADNPRYIALIKIDRPQVGQYERWGSTTAAPTFSELAQQLVVLLDVPPDSARALADAW
jgi:cell division protein FtsI/penicillin-binding protein 2